jgi:hypothetical protein
MPLCLLQYSQNVKKDAAPSIIISRTFILETVFPIDLPHYSVQFISSSHNNMFTKNRTALLASYISIVLASTSAAGAKGILLIKLI